MSSSGTSWRVDTPGETDDLEPITLEPPTSGTDGGALLPTLTVHGNYNRKGASKHSGDGLATALGRMLPTLLASDATKPKRSQASIDAGGGAKLTNLLPTLISSDWKSQSEAKQAGNSRPLREVVGTSAGGALNPEWCEWYMGFPIGATGSNLLATLKPRFVRRLLGKL
jgi:DNA (cytosine-5)-methyltransferase 1